MTTHSLFDVQCGFGGASKGSKDVVSSDDWLAEMDRLSIARALVRTVPWELDVDVLESNGRLIEACANSERLTPCPVVLPASGGDTPTEAEQAAAAIDAGAGAVWIRPAHDTWSLKPWNCDRLMHELADRRLPVMCLAQVLGLETVAELAGRYPDLRIILAYASMREQRILLPLLQHFGNVLLSIGSNFSLHRGVEQVVGAIGAERLLFGSGFPEVDASMAVGQLAYAEISDEEREMIGALNMERLIEGIRR